MTVTGNDLDTKLAALFIHCKDVETAKAEILEMFSSEPDHEHKWTEQDISEQMTKIIRKYSLIYGM